MTITQPLGGAPGAPDFAAVTNRQQQAWATGDFNASGTCVMRCQYLQLTATRT